MRSPGQVGPAHRSAYHRRTDAADRTMVQSESDSNVRLCGLFKNDDRAPSKTKISLNLNLDPKIFPIQGSSWSVSSGLVTHLAG